VVRGDKVDMLKDKPSFFLPLSEKKRKGKRNKGELVAGDGRLAEPRAFVIPHR